MTDCDCEKARKELEEFLHNELCSDDAADIRQHLHECPDCSEEYRAGALLTEVIQRGCRESAPEELKDQVLLRLREMQRSHN